MRFWALAIWTIALYSALRLLFLVWNWKLLAEESFSDLSLAFFHGLRFDLYAICLLSTVFFLIEWAGNWLSPRIRLWDKAYFYLWLVLQIPFFLLNLTDIELVNFTGRRFTRASMFLIGEMHGGTSTQLLTVYWPLSLGGIGIFLIFLLGSHRIIQKIPPLRLKPAKWIATAVGTLVILVVGIRGGIQPKPIDFINAQIFPQLPLNLLVMNSSFSLLRSLKKEFLPKEIYFSEAEMLSHLNARLPGEPLLKAPHSEKQLNVVIIIVESLSLELMGLPNRRTGYTPFLDSLSKRSLFFKNSFANGRRSIEAVSSILGGLPSLMTEPFVSSPFSTNHLVGLGERLKTKNYHSSFFHGGNNGTMFFDQFTASLGIKHYFGANEYPDLKDHDGNWGIFDEPFLKWALDLMNEFPKPFASTIFTLTSHHPFKIPDAYKGKFPQGTQDIHESIGYVDFALQEFFKKAQTFPWYQDTLFVITADHTYKISEPEFDHEIGRYQVPILFFQEGRQWPKEVDLSQVVSHIDIMPSILDVLGIEKKPEYLMGRSVFLSGPRYVTLSLDDRYWLVENQHFLFQQRGQASQLFDFNFDRFEKSPIINQEREQKRLENQLLATRQYYSQGMWENKLYLQ